MPRHNARQILTMFILLFATVFCIASSSHADTPSEHNLAVSIYGGAMTDDNWRQSISGQANLVDSYLIAGALGWTFYRPENRNWSLELEGNVVRHFGIQDHFEFNGPILTARWEYFPWDNYVDTSIAYGLGPSYATHTPEVEVDNDGTSEKFLLFWHIDVTLAPPHSNWATFFRLHHRSSCFGTLAEKGGGNALTMGLRYEF